ncbi:MAG TPA: c-type cytochrome [Bacillota bacterium]|nr:c-type cytochrome [Bacillota bacterium]
MKRGKGMKFVGDSRVTSERTPNVPLDYSEYPGRTEAFWPNFLLKEWLVGAVFLIGFMTLVLAEPPPLENYANPTTSGYIPLPDWYFLFLYQLLKYQFAAGPYILFGILIIPGLAFGALLLAPFLDNGPGRRPPQRPIAVAMMILALTAVSWLTYESAAEVDWEKRAEDNRIVLGEEEEEYELADLDYDEADPGFDHYKNSCASCHGDDLEGSQAGPTLLGIDHDEEGIKDIIINGIEGDPGMPAGMFDGSDEEMDELVEFIYSLNEQIAEDSDGDNNNEDEEDDSNDNE